MTTEVESDVSEGDAGENMRGSLAAANGGWNNDA